MTTRKMTTPDVMTKVEYWKQKFGLYPVFIDPKSNRSRFLMLNGGSKDFCLQTSPSDNDSSDGFYSNSWSTNTKNFVTFDKDFVQVHNWLQGKPVKHQKKQVDENPDKFCEYLSLQSPKTPDDAVPFIIGIFRELRNLVGKQEPEESLNLLFRLLIDIEDDDATIDWGIAGDIVVPSNFGYYVERIRKGVKSIAPNRDLLLRHVSGALFQEAHKEIIYFDRQMDLFGRYSNKLVTKSAAYSGIHYTPSYLARTIVENCLKQLNLNKPNIKIFDPACGSSEFLIETLKQLQHQNYHGNIKVIGWDVSPSAVCTSNFLLKYEQQTQWCNGKLEFEIRMVTDSLSEQWDDDYDLIVMNPPFVSWELLKDKNRKNTILEALGASYERKRPNVASAFFYQAVKSLNSDGAIGCILPCSMLTSEIYSKMRQEIRDKININLIAKLGNYVFSNALTDVCFIIGSKIDPLEKSIASSKVIWCKNEKSVDQEALLDLRKMEANNQQAVENNSYSIYSMSQFPLNANNWKVISHKNNVFKQNLDRFVSEGQLHPLTDIFSISQGAISGKDIFRISKENYSVLPKTEKKFFRPVITNKSIKCGRLTISEYIWFPYDKNGLMLKEEAELESISFAKEKLIANKKVLTSREGIKEWWGLTRPRTWQYEKEVRLYSSRFGSSDSFTIDLKGDCVIEEGNAFTPNKKFNADDYYFYLSVLSSNTFDILLSIYSKQIMSGYDLGKIQIKDIPMPNVHLRGVRTSEVYCRLVELGKELINGNQYVKHVIGDIVKILYPNE